VECCRICGHYISACFRLCVMQLWIRLCLKPVVYFNLRLEYRESWVATLQVLFLLCKASLTKLFEIHRWSWTRGVHFSISAGRGNFVYWPSQQRVRQLSSAQRTLHLEVCDEVIHIYKSKQVKSVLTGLSVEASGSHSMGRDPNKDGGSENRSRQGDQNLNLSCNSSNLFACLFVV